MKSFDLEGKEAINHLLRNSRWPGITSITFGDGRKIVFEVDFPKGSQPIIHIEFETTLEVFLKANPHEETYLIFFRMHPMARMRYVSVIVYRKTKGLSM